MYLPQEAQKSFTAALAALGGAVSRPAIDAVKNGSQIADRLSITFAFWETKRDSIPVFSHFVKITKTESETLYTIFC